MNSKQPGDFLSQCPSENHCPKCPHSRWSLTYLTTHTLAHLTLQHILKKNIKDFFGFGFTLLLLSSHLRKVWQIYFLNLSKLCLLLSLPCLSSTVQGGIIHNSASWKGCMGCPAPADSHRPHSAVLQPEGMSTVQTECAPLSLFLFKVLFIL